MDSYGLFTYYAADADMKKLSVNCPQLSFLDTIIAQGGDADTNARIVGGMIGAAVGYTGIPERIRTITNISVESKNARAEHTPDYLYSRQKIMRLINLIYWDSPETLSILPKNIDVAALFK